MRKASAPRAPGQGLAREEEAGPNAAQRETGPAQANSPGTRHAALDSILAACETLSPVFPLCSIPQALQLAEVVGLSARRWEIAWAFHLPQVWSTKQTVVHVQRWCGLLMTQVFHALQVEITRPAAWRSEVSVDPLDSGLTFLRTASFGCDPGLIRPSTRHRIEVPQSPPPSGGASSCRSATPSAERSVVFPNQRHRLKGGALHVLE